MKKFDAKKTFSTNLQHFKLGTAYIKWYTLASSYTFHLSFYYFAVMLQTLKMCIKKYDAEKYFLQIQSTPH